jgi:hypothetical protein
MVIYQLSGFTIVSIAAQFTIIQLAVFTYIAVLRSVLGISMELSKNIG